MDVCFPIMGTSSGFSCDNQFHHLLRQRAVVALPAGGAEPRAHEVVVDKLSYMPAESRLGGGDHLYTAECIECLYRYMRGADRHPSGSAPQQPTLIIEVIP